MPWKHYHNLYKKLLILLFFMSSFFSFGQIINIENLRRVTDTTGLSGFARLDLRLQKNTNQIFSISNRIRLQYKTPKSLWLFIHNLDFSEANSEQLVSSNTQHLRFNHKLKPKIKWEAFLQSQRDKIAAIKFRGLAGTGLRFKLTSLEKYKFYLGSLIMFEHEKSVNEVENIHNDWRSSSYFSFSLYPKENITIVSTSYYQPRLDNFIDYRILSETSLSFKIIKNLKFTTSFTYMYDKFPVTGIVQEQYLLSNGLVYFFD